MRLASTTLLAIMLLACDSGSPSADDAPSTPKAADAKSDAKSEAKSDAEAEPNGDETKTVATAKDDESNPAKPTDAKDETKPADPEANPTELSNGFIPDAASNIPVETSGSFSLVAKAGTRMGLHPLFDDEVAISVGPHLIRVDKDGSVAPNRKLFAGLPRPRDPAEERITDTLSAWYVLAAGGRWPDEVIMRATIESGFRSDVELPMAMRFDSERWQPMSTGNKKYEWWPVEIHPWIDGSLLARRAFHPVYEGIDPADPEDEPSAQQQRAVAKAIERAKSLIVIRGLPKSPDVGKIVAFQSWGTGQILAVGASKQPELRVAGIDGIVSRTKLPVIEGGRLDLNGIVAKGVEDAYIFGSEGPPEGDHVPYLVRWHGGKMERVPTPECHTIGAVAEDAAGELWALCDNVPNTAWQMDGGSLWHRGSDNAWKEVSLPEGWGKPTQVVFTAGELWVGTRNAVARTGKVEQSVRFGDLDEVAQLYFEWGDPIPIEGFCATVTFRLKSDVGDAEALARKLDAAKLAHDDYWTVRLRKFDYRAKPIVALELYGATEPANVRKFKRAFERALGDVLHPAQCYLEPGDDGTIGEWSNVE